MDAADFRFLINRLDKIEKNLSKKIDCLEDKVDKRIAPLNDLRNKVVGGSIAISAVITLIMNFFFPH